MACPNLKDRGREETTPQKRPSYPIEAGPCGIKQYVKSSDYVTSGSSWKKPKWKQQKRDRTKIARKSCGSRTTRDWYEIDMSANMTKRKDVCSVQCDQGEARAPDIERQDGKTHMQKQNCNDITHQRQYQPRYILRATEDQLWHDDDTGGTQRHENGPETISDRLIPRKRESPTNFFQGTSRRTSSRRPSSSTST